MVNDPGSPWANSMQCLFCILIQNQWKMLLDLPGPIPLCFLHYMGNKKQSKMLLELLRPMPSGFLIKAFLTISGKYSWTSLGQSAKIFLCQIFIRNQWEMLQEPPVPLPWHLCIISCL